MQLFIFHHTAAHPVGIKCAIVIEYSNDHCKLLFMVLSYIYNQAGYHRYYHSTKVYMQIYSCLSEQTVLYIREERSSPALHHAYWAGCKCRSAHAVPKRCPSGG